MTEIDVSGCKHYWNTHSLELCKVNFDNNYYSNVLPLAEKCNDHKDCYYRQLKRLEAENAKLKEENFKLGQIDVKKVTLVENRQLEEENKKLKEDLDLFRKAHDNEQAQRRMFEQKLEKIKEIAKECSIHNACMSDCAYFEHCDGWVTELFLQIIEGAEE